MPLKPECLFLTPCKLRTPTSLANACGTKVAASQAHFQRFHPERHSFRRLQRHQDAVLVGYFLFNTVYFKLICSFSFFHYLLHTNITVQILVGLFKGHWADFSAQLANLFASGTMTHS